MHSSYSSGFTVAEVLIAIAMLFGAGYLVNTQLQHSAAAERDLDRKTAINAVHFYLKDIYSEQNDGFPSTLSEATLKSLAKDNVRDPAGRLVGAPGSDLRYEPTDCNNSVCQYYTLRADLEQEEDFIRSSE